MPPKTIDALGREPSEKLIEFEEIKKKIASLEKYKGPLLTEIPKITPTLEQIDILFGKIPKPKTIATYNEPPQIYSSIAFVNYLLMNISSEVSKNLLLLANIKKNSKLSKGLAELHLKTIDLEYIKKCAGLFHKS